MSLHTALSGAFLHQHIDFNARYTGYSERFGHSAEEDFQDQQGLGHNRLFCIFVDNKLSEHRWIS
jgi:hypothetical protein